MAFSVLFPVTSFRTSCADVFSVVGWLINVFLTMNVLLAAMFGQSYTANSRSAGYSTVLPLFDPVPTRRPSSSAKAYDGGQARVDEQTRAIFQPTNRNITVSPGERAVLKCKVVNLGTKTVTWRKRDEVHPLTIGLFSFDPDTRLSVDFNQRSLEWTLQIQDVRPSDEGVYCCQISTKTGRDTYDIRLNVRTIQVSGTDYVEPGGQIQLMCNATGRPEPPQNIDWFKNDEKIRSDAHNGIFITKKIETKVLVSVLIIKRSRKTDEGTYVCRSSNNESASINVMVLETSSPSIDKRGFESTDVICYDTASGTQVDDELCDDNDRPSRRTRFCWRPSCDRVYAWVAGEWGPCSQTCGEGALRQRPTYCVSESDDGTSLVPTGDDEFCDPHTRPVQQQPCPDQIACPAWVAGQWSLCSVTCGTGHQLRAVACRYTGSHLCPPDEKPHDRRPCRSRIPCFGQQLITGDDHDTDGTSALHGSSVDLSEDQFQHPAAAAMTGSGWILDSNNRNHLDDWRGTDVAESRSSKISANFRQQESVYDEDRDVRSVMTSSTSNTVKTVSDTKHTLEHDDVTSAPTVPLQSVTPAVKQQQNPLQQRQPVMAETPSNVNETETPRKSSASSPIGEIYFVPPPSHKSNFDLDVDDTYDVVQSDSRLQTGNSGRQANDISRRENELVTSVGAFQQQPCNKSVDVDKNSIDAASSSSSSNCGRTVTTSAFNRRNSIDVDTSHFVQLGQLEVVSIVVGGAATVLRGTTVYIQCTATTTDANGLSRPIKRVEWKGNGQMIKVVSKETPKANRNTRIRASSNGMLRIRKIKKTDAGRYSCSAGMGGYRVVATTTVNVWNQKEALIVHRTLLNRLRTVDSESHSGASQALLALERIEETSKLITPMEEGGGLKNKSYSIGHLRMAMGDPLPLIYSPSEWTQCSERCGRPGGMQRRNVSCAVLGDSWMLDVDLSLCRADGKLVQPEVDRDCTDADCPAWVAGPWPATCSEDNCVGLGVAVRRRTIYCAVSPNAENIQVDDEECDRGSKPAMTQSCENPRCQAVWVTSNWTACQGTCGQPGIKTRAVQCVWTANKKNADGQCVNNARPDAGKPCLNDPCPERAGVGVPTCRDMSKHCQLVAMLRMCRYPQYRTGCCRSCTRQPLVAGLDGPGALASMAYVAAFEKAEKLISTPPS